jgi:hypothetical protein
MLRRCAVCWNSCYLLSTVLVRRRVHLALAYSQVPWGPVVLSWLTLLVLLYTACVPGTQIAVTEAIDRRSEVPGVCR